MTLLRLVDVVLPSSKHLVMPHFRFSCAFNDIAHVEGNTPIITLGAGVPF